MAGPISDRVGFSAMERYRPIVDDWELFQQSHGRPLPAVVWTNTLKATPEKIAEMLPADGINIEPLPWRPGGFKLLVHDGKPGRHWGFLGGLYHVQEEASLLPVWLLDPRCSDRVLDLCAAPGNKTAQIAVAMGNRGTVVANDRDYHRIRAVHHMIERLGILNTSTTRYDGANYPKGAGLFDKVLVDAPCSCEGTLRKNPELVLDPTGGLSRKMSGGQRALLRKAFQLCKPGGRIVYSTCTYAPEENEAVIDGLLREVGPGAVRLLPARIEGFRACEGLRAWNRDTYHESLRLALRIWPHQNDTGGFFVALLEKGNGKVSGATGQDKGGATDENRVAEPSTHSGGRLPECPDLSDFWLQILEQRFGMSQEGFAPYTFFQRTARDLRVVNRDHQPPVEPRPESTGMVFMRAQSRFPKLTTAAAMIFGRSATRNTIDLDAEQIQAYVRRQETEVRADQVQSCTGIGYVIARHNGVAFGIALYLPGEQGKGGTIQSQFPKAWSLG